MYLKDALKQLVYNTSSKHRIASGTVFEKQVANARRR